MTKAKILSFLKSRIHAVISTVSTAHQPESALIGFGETEQLEIIFGTETTTRKYQNLKKNPNAAFVFGWEEDSITVQYEGIARELPKDEWDKYLKMYHDKVPSAKKYQSFPNQTYFIVIPTWIRYSDLSGEAEVVEEFSF